MHLELLYAKGRQFCPGEDELTPINNPPPPPPPPVNGHIVSW